MNIARKVFNWIQFVRAYIISTPSPYVLFWLIFFLPFAMASAAAEPSDGEYVYLWATYPDNSHRYLTEIFSYRDGCDAELKAAYKAYLENMGLGVYKGIAIDNGSKDEVASSLRSTFLNEKPGTYGRVVSTMVDTFHFDFSNECASKSAMHNSAGNRKMAAAIIVTDDSAERSKERREDERRKSTYAEQARQDAARKDVLTKTNAKQNAENERRAKELVALRERMEKQKAKMCSMPSKTYVVNFSDSPEPLENIKKTYAKASSQQGLYCSGPKMQLGPLRCNQLLKVMGEAIGKCTAVVTCGAWEYPCGGSGQSQ